jgi:Flp pilus assembly protein TadG
MIAMSNHTLPVPRRRFWPSQSGASAVEFAIIAPVLIAGLLSVVEFGRVMYSKVEFEYAVYNASRFGMAIKDANTTRVQTALRDNLILLKPANLNAVTFSEVTNADKTRTATLTASYRVDFLVPLTNYASITLTRKTSFLRGP